MVGAPTFRRLIKLVEAAQSLAEARSWEDSLEKSNQDVSVGYDVWKGNNGMEILQSKVLDRNACLDDLRALPFSDRIVVFGSVLRGPDVLPGDIDVFVDEPSKEEQDALIALCQKHFGKLDVFVRINGALGCQNSSTYDTGVRFFEKVRKPDQMLAGIENGAALSSVGWNYEIPDRLSTMYVRPRIRTQVKKTPEDEKQQEALKKAAQTVFDVARPLLKFEGTLSAFDAVAEVGVDQLSNLEDALKSSNMTFASLRAFEAFVKPFAERSTGDHWERRWY